MSPLGSLAALRHSSQRHAKHQGQSPRGPSYKEGEDPLVLRDLSEPSVGLVTWSRVLPFSIQSALTEWGKNTEGELESRIFTHDYCLKAAFRTMDRATRAWMTEDIALLIELFSIVAKTDELKLTFGPIRSDRCRKFHQDNLCYRLICTYAGPGTEWVPAEAVDQSVLRRPPLCHVEANRTIVQTPSAIRHASTGDVVMMKGERHPDGTGLVHRSPPIEASGGTRVALILSTREDYT